MDISTVMLPVLSLGGMGLIFGLGLGYAGVKFKVEEDERLPLVRDALPGANCGGCGFAGCDAFAAAVVNGTAPPNGCPVGGPTVTQAVAEILGLVAEEQARTCAFIKCAGTCEKSQNNYEYQGMADCTAMSHLAGSGAKACSYGCLGGGSCLNACAFGAIEMKDGIARVIEEKCTSCGKCVEACPKKLIEIVPYDSKVRASCNSKDNGKIAKGNCSVACIGCKLCEKACEFDAVHVKEFLAKVDYEKCTQCGACVKKCPTKVFGPEPQA